MKDIIDIYRKKNHYLAALKDAVRCWDGKVVNKRFDNFLDNNYGITLYRYASQWEFSASDLPRVKSYGGNIFLTIYGDLNNHRLDSTKLIRRIDEQLSYNSEQITLMEKEQKKKDTLIKKYNTLVEKIEELTKSMSYEFKEKYKDEFQPIIYKC